MDSRRTGGTVGRVTSINYLPPAAQDRLRARLAAEHDNRTEALAALANARSEAINADDNGAKDAAQAELGAVDGRIQVLESLLQRAAAAPVPGPGVAPGMTVTLRWPDGGLETLFVGPSLAAPAGLDVVGPDAPLGAALLGAQPGQTVRFEAPNGVLEVEVAALA